MTDINRENNPTPKNDIVEEKVEEIASDYRLKDHIKTEVRHDFLRQALSELYDAGRREEYQRIKNEYGYMNDGCGCCSEESLEKALSSEQSV